MAAPTAAALRTLVAQRKALVALARQVAQDQTGGLLSSALDIVQEAFKGKGAIAYQPRGSDLALVSDLGVPRRARPWLSNLSLTDEPWFVAQRAALSLRIERDLGSGAAGERHPGRSALTDGGWASLAAYPVAIGRQLLGVLVFGASDANAFDADTEVFFQGASHVLALALARESDAARGRDERLRESRTVQLATIGLVAAQTASELASPLASLELQMNELCLLLEALRAEGGGERLVLRELGILGEDTRATAHALQEVVGRLLALSQESQAETLELGRIVEGSLALVRGRIEARGIRVELTPAPEPLPISGRAENLHMLFVQLLLYAAQECALARLRDATIRIGLQRDADRISCALDTPAKHEARPRIFDAFYQRGNKPAATDMSFDLAMAKQIVLSHEGHIEVDGAGGHVSRIRVVLPCAGTARPTLRISSKPPRSMPPSGPATPLVWIDRDAAFARSVRRCFRSHETLRAGTVAEARELLDSMAELPELVFCALDLPDGSGLDLHRSAPPALAQRFVFLTGGVMPADDATYLLGSGCPTLVAPIGLEDVAALLSGSRDPNHTPVVARTLSVPPSEEPSTPHERRSDARLGRDAPTVPPPARRGGRRTPSSPIVPATSAPSQKGAGSTCPPTPSTPRVTRPPRRGKTTEPDAPRPPAVWPTNPPVERLEVDGAAPPAREDRAPPPHTAEPPTRRSALHASNVVPVARIARPSPGAASTRPASSPPSRKPRASRPPRGK